MLISHKSVIGLFVSPAEIALHVSSFTAELSTLVSTSLWFQPIRTPYPTCYHLLRHLPYRVSRALD